jgi:hypothetical protein
MGASWSTSAFRVELVPFDERPTELAGEQFPHCRFAGAGDSHQDHDHSMSPVPIPAALARRGCLRKPDRMALGNPILMSYGSPEGLAIV